MPEDPIYTAFFGTEMRIGLAAQVFAADTAAALLNNNEDTLLTTNGLDTVDGSGFYVNEGGANDLMMDWAIGGAYCTKTKKAVTIGAPNGKLSDLGASTTILIYDFETNTWSNVRNPWGISSSHVWDNVCCDGSGLVYKGMYGATADIQTFNLETMTVGSPIPLPASNIGGGGGGWSTTHALCWHPLLGNEGSLIHVNGAGGRVNKWDKETQVWTNIASGLTSIVNLAPTAHYNATTNRLVVGSNLYSNSSSPSDPLYLIDQDGTVTQANATPPAEYSSMMLIPTDTKYSLLFSGDGQGDAIYTLDTSNGVWSNAIANPSTLAGLASRFGKTAPFPITGKGYSLFLNYEFSGASTTTLFKFNGVP